MTLRTWDVLKTQLKKAKGAFILHGGFSAVDVLFYPWVNEYKVAEISLGSHSAVKEAAGQG